jgi:hypothetical protein
MRHAGRSARRLKSRQQRHKVRLRGLVLRVQPEPCSPGRAASWGRCTEFIRCGLGRPGMDRCAPHRRGLGRPGMDRCAPHRRGLRRPGMDRCAPRRRGLKPPAGTTRSPLKRARALTHASALQRASRRFSGGFQPLAGGAAHDHGRSAHPICHPEGAAASRLSGCDGPWRRVKDLLSGRTGPEPRAVLATPYGRSFAPRHRFGAAAACGRRFTQDDR